MAATRRATIVGINFYEHAEKLSGCVNDAKNIKSLLSKNYDQTKNFDTELITGENFASKVERKSLRDNLKDLFKYKYEIALFYFAGHGYVESTGGFLLTSECRYGDDGISTNDLMHMVNTSPSTNKIIILDCCHSGVTGNPSFQEDKARLNEGVTILTASGKDQYSVEKNNSGVFTALLTHALEGGAANLLGEITPGSVYAHIDQSLSAIEQRPFFKTNVDRFISLRKVQAPIALRHLHQITKLFPTRETVFKLDPSFEPESTTPVKKNTRRFAILQKYNRLNLVVPVGAPHMYHAAIRSKGCKLTVLGKHYWNLVNTGNI